MNKKVAILHDTFLYRGGGERLVMYMRDALDADLITGFFDSGSYSMQEIQEHASGKIVFRELIKSRVFTKGFRHLRLKFTFLFGTKFLSQYRSVIFSGDCLAAVRNCHPDAKKIYYCHTPPRYIFDKKEWYEEQLQKHYGFLYLLVRPLYRLIRYFFEQQYLRDISRMDVVLTNSQTVRDRIKKYCNTNAEVVYPPVNLEKFSHIAPINNEKDSDTYFLSFARLAKLKRVDKIIEAFVGMPEMKLIVTYGANDPERDYLFDLAKDAKNIEFRTGVDDAELIDLISNARATIYIPEDEDFGMSPVESMSCGTPVIGVDEGGLKETIIHGKTGALLSSSDLTRDIQSTIQDMISGEIVFVPEVCQRRAQDFSVESFADKIRSYMQSPGE